MSDHTPLTKADRLAFLLRKTVADAAGAEVKAERQHVIDDLLELHEEHGVKQVAVKLPDDEQIATLTISQPTPRTEITDDDAFIDWAAEHYPDAVEKVTVRRVDPQLLKVIAAEYPEADGRHYSADGEQVPGVRTHTPPPSSFSVKYADGDRSRERLIGAWRGGELAELDTGDTLPALEWTGNTA
ncbi:hypothetical protein [Nesterenkonia sp. HG001]|uniref:hypothetical protein n=1 Tax=Nesterenkonia sp. HG001 TaxID=2983207 RepID=UPI002AC576C1|nr:hypothetical protein [Nesterenkonia sp. HG001]MDZ5077893.1 hypothetical protein [Nesterenkonia sp. HG001]